MFDSLFGFSAVFVFIGKNATYSRDIWQYKLESATLEQLCRNGNGGECVHGNCIASLKMKAIIGEMERKLKATSGFVNIPNGICAIMHSCSICFGKLTTKALYGGLCLVILACVSLSRTLSSGSTEAIISKLGACNLRYGTVHFSNIQFNLPALKRTYAPL